MTEVYDGDSDVYFGEVDEPLEDWRGSDVEDEDDPDDELPENTEDVEAILGFDPKDI